MATPQKPEFSETELQNAQILWGRFLQYSKVGIIAVIILMILMALFLL